MNKTTITQESTEDFLMSQLEVCKTKEDLILEFWFHWVESVTTKSVDYQKVIASSAVNKWFLIEFRKEETEFRTLIKRYPDTKGRDKDWLWCKCVSKLMSRFPKALLDDVKRLEQKPKIPGIKIEFLTHILN